ncbi:hypothetical protein AB1Y20_014121 [Prymnesium parvum]|uniref:Uncharacterized protein n=1 Tax=Prymnesium parvum TaxID=97485 RepID=A0AB34IH91_PRYPA
MSVDFDYDENQGNTARPHRPPTPPNSRVTSGEHHTRLRGSLHVLNTEDSQTKRRLWSRRPIQAAKRGKTHGKGKTLTRQDNRRQKI